MVVSIGTARDVSVSARARRQTAVGRRCPDTSRSPGGSIRRGQVVTFPVKGGPKRDQCEVLITRQPFYSQGGLIDDLLDLYCLRPSVGTVPEQLDVRVCGVCAAKMERE